MDTDLIVKALIAIAPVVLLLIVFDRLDAFNLISAREIAVLLGAGGAVAALSFLANWRVMDGFPIGFSSYTRYVSPIIEESLKAAPIIYLYARNRLGFKVDAAIAGFAVGAGFSVIENIWYLFTITNANVSAWIVRGFGTAIMHGGATAIFAIISHEMTERQAESSAAHYRFNPLLFAPGLLVAMAIHSTFNHFPGQPLVIMALTLLLAPAAIFLALIRSDHATQQWLAADRIAHENMLAEIRAGHFTDTPRGQQIAAIAARLGDRAEDARAYVELKTELILRAEELIHAAQSGQSVAPTESDKEKFARLGALEHRLGKTTLAALAAPLGFTRNDLWELSRLHARVRGDA
ncbi:MAG: PrsW family intramembrane metalloprotease [Hyphomonadaceae bacterium]|nr:PrsW family intramembrane metalloprotease [Hyphomonadaceae bacterium]